MSESDFYLLFSCSPGIGPKRFQQLITHFGSAKRAWSETREEYLVSGISYLVYDRFDKFRKSFDVITYKEKLKKAQVTFMPQNSKEYPSELLQLDNPPIGLFVKGNLSVLQNKKFGVVGTRKVTSYGREVTELLATQLVSYGYTIVSGLAIGIDAIAHKTALDCKGLTIAILGCGVDCCNPSENEKLYRNICENQGLIISEYPLGASPTKGSFPARNRLIAALTIGVLVTEAGADSGSLITADWAKKLGKKIFAVPGPITSRQSDGTSYLLKKGAVLVHSGNDLIQDLGFTRSAGSGQANYELKKVAFNIEELNIDKDEKEILKIIAKEDCTIDNLKKQTNFPIAKLAMLLGNLELLGFIHQKNDGRYSLVKI